MSRTRLGVAAGILVMAQPAFAAPCLDRPDATALVVFALPDLLTAVGRRCSAVLPATSVLVQSAEMIAGRYRDASEAAWPLAAGAIDRLAGFAVTRTLGPDAARRTVSDLVRRAVNDKLETAQCAKADAYVDILSPLPSRNLARLAIAMLDSRPASPKDPIQLCPVIKP